MAGSPSFSLACRSGYGAGDVFHIADVCGSLSVRTTSRLRSHAPDSFSLLPVLPQHTTHGWADSPGVKLLVDLSLTGWLQTEVTALGHGPS